MTPTRLDAATYARAESLLTPYRSRLALRANVRARWLDHGARFWYRVETADGAEYVVVDPVAKTRAVTDESIAAKPPKLGPVDVPSPDQTRAVFRRDHDLWVRDLVTGAETPLTTDGAPDYAYGTTPDSGTPFMMLRGAGLPHLPPAVAWSPDSTRIVTHRTDQRAVRTMPLVESTPPGGGRPELFTQRYAIPGDDALPLAELVVIDVTSGTAVPADTEPLLMPYMSPVTMHKVWWTGDGSAVYFLDQPRDQRTLWLKRFDPATGEVRTVITESGDTRVEPAQQITQKPIVRALGGTGEVVWYSQRDGWGHLYLYADDGTLRGQITSGEWAVQEILHVDEDARSVYFTASGLIADAPYRRQVCWASLDGSGFARLVDDDLDHAVQVPENGAYFVDAASAVDTPPVTTVRDWDGRVVVELERANIDPLLATGWRPPEQFSATAADGETTVYGLLYLPPDFDPDGSYPVIDHPYPGPQIHRQQPTFDADFYGHEAEAVAALGFVVVVLDGRGTPGRSKAFHDASYGHLADAGSLTDHVTAIEQLAETRPWMDLDRVGVFGMSGGGFTTVRALCQFPEFYRVGVAECGNHDNRYYHSLWAETYDGPVNDEVYAASANTEIADRLEGKLLLVHGEMDDNVTPHLTMRLVRRLIAANKDFELLIVPGAEHSFLGYGHYTTRRRWDFLVRHLMGIEPPAGYRLADIPLTPEMLEHIFS